MLHLSLDGCSQAPEVLPFNCFNSLDNIGTIPEGQTPVRTTPRPALKNEAVRLQDKRNKKIFRRPHQSLAERAKDRIKKSLSRENLGILSHDKDVS